MGRRWRRGRALKSQVYFVPHVSIGRYTVSELKQGVIRRHMDKWETLCQWRHTTFSSSESLTNSFFVIIIVKWETLRQWRHATFSEQEKPCKLIFHCLSCIVKWETLCKWRHTPFSERGQPYKLVFRCASYNATYIPEQKSYISDVTPRFRNRERVTNSLSLFVKWRHTDKSETLCQ